MSDQTVSSGGSIASVGKRIGGGFIDLFVTFVLIMILGAFGGFGSTGGGDGVSASVNVDGAPFIYMAIVVFLIFALMEWRWGKTPGKMLLKMHVELANGERPGFLQALIRNLLRLIDGIGMYLVGLILVAIDKDNRRLGDLAAGTRVVNDD